MKTPYHPLTARKLREALTYLPKRGHPYEGLCAAVACTSRTDGSGLPDEYYCIGNLLEDTTPDYSRSCYLPRPPDMTPGELQAVRFMFGCFLALYLADLEREARQ